MEKITAEESLKAAIAAHKEFGRRDTTSDNNVIAKNILHGDLGYFTDRGLADYYLDYNVRDRLLAHARQDAALAVLNSASILKELSRLRRRQNATILLLFVIISLMFWTTK